MNRPIRQLVKSASFHRKAGEFLIRHFGFMDHYSISNAIMLCRHIQVVARALMKVASESILERIIETAQEELDIWRGDLLLIKANIERRNQHEPLQAVGRALIHCIVNNTVVCDGIYNARRNQSKRYYLRTKQFACDFLSLQSHNNPVYKVVLSNFPAAVLRIYQHGHSEASQLARRRIANVGWLQDHFAYIYAQDVVNAPMVEYDGFQYELSEYIPDSLAEIVEVWHPDGPRSQTILDAEQIERIDQWIEELFYLLTVLYDKYRIVYTDIKPSNIRYMHQIVLSDIKSLLACDVKHMALYSMHYRPPEYDQTNSCSYLGSLWALAKTMCQLISGGFDLQSLPVHANFQALTQRSQQRLLRWSHEVPTLRDPARARIHLPTFPAKVQMIIDEYLGTRPMVDIKKPR